MTTPSDRPESPLTRRRFLAWSAVSIAVVACDLARPTDRPSTTGQLPATSLPGQTLGQTTAPTGAATSTPAPASPAPSPTASPAPPVEARRTLYRDGALTDARSDRLDVGISILVEGGVIRWIRPSDGEEDPGPRDGLEIVDASGATFVPGMVDAHCHVTLPGGAKWTDRGADNPRVLLDVAERNARLMTASGVRWGRDVGAPYVELGGDGRRALSLTVRDLWRDRPGYPYLRAAGTWLTRRGSLPVRINDLEADSADELLNQALGQLDDGADLVKLYLDGPDDSVSPWSVDEISRVVRAVHERGATVTAHSGRIAGARAGVRAGVDALEHGFELDRALCSEMAERGTFLVSTLAVFRSWRTFAETAPPATFVRLTGGRAFIAARRERARESIALARAAGVRIATGTDAGGGSLRANQLAWEVEQLVGAGLDPWQALASATWRGGQLLGERNAGTIREGGPADFFLVHGNPLSEPEALWRVWRVAWAD